MLDMVDLADMRQFLELSATDTSRDPILVNLIFEISIAMEEYCHREFEKAAETEYFDGGNECLFLKRIPLSGAVPNFSIDIRVDTEHLWGSDTQLDDDFFVAESDSGILTYNYGRFLGGAQTIKVVYTGGYTRATLPKDLTLAAKLWINSILDANVHDWSSFVSSGGVMQVRAEGIPARIRKLMDPHMRMVANS